MTPAFLQRPIKALDFLPVIIDEYNRNKAFTAVGSSEGKVMTCFHISYERSHQDNW